MPKAGSLPDVGVVPVLCSFVLSIKGSVHPNCTHAMFLRFLSEIFHFHSDIMEVNGTLTG